MNKNEEFTLECTDLSDQGFGIGHYKGMTVFVSDLLPSESARVRVIKQAKTYAIARVEERFVTSPQRVNPKCDAAGRCGGCSLMHLDYAAQLSWKHKQLADLFKGVDENIEVLPPLGMESPYGYRNKAQFPVGIINGKVQGGFYRPRSNTIVPIGRCEIQDEHINEIYGWLIDHLSLSQAQSLRHLLIRYSKGTGQGQVVFIGKENVKLAKLTEQLVEQFPYIQSVVFNENLRNDNVILGERYFVLHGSDSIDEKCLDLTIRLHFKSFFQVNPTMMNVLYSKALEFADLKKDDRVIELYSGTGTIGLLAAKKAGSVTGVEIVKEAVENAKENQRINHIENAKFVCMDATDFAAENQDDADVVFVDPPRKGMSAQGIEDIVRLSPRTLIYISCNPRTLARDLKLFGEKGYHADVIQPVDMFSHTSGMECVARLRKKTDQPHGAEDERTQN